ncbi:unnamed protein product [Rhodiola kirilowii]
MEDARCWMWGKQRADIHNSTMSGSSRHNSYDASWEERAFAEDAAGPLGGCVWPPRSYSCNFCGREFRSAQALGGHMNVHRRDRARLKQSLNPGDAFDHHQPSQKFQHSSQSQKLSVDPHVPYQVCKLAYNPNPNPVTFDIPAPSSLALKISSPSAREYISSIDQDPTFIQLGLRKYHSSNTPKRPRSGNLVAADPNVQTSDRIMDAEKRDSKSLKDFGERALMHRDKPDISVSLNLFLFQTRARKQSKNESAEDDDQDDGDSNIGSKRMKPTAEESSAMSSSSYIKSSVVDRFNVQQKLSPDQRKPASSIHELDLELRLGEGPKVK